MNSNRIIEQVSEAIISRAKIAKDEAIEKGKKSFTMVYPYDRTGIEPHEILSKGHFLTILENSGYTVTSSPDTDKVTVKFK